jgi:hypothetical protein
VTSPVDNSSASAIIKAQLSQWGLSDLYADVDRLSKDGLGEDAINVQLQQTDAYKRRFAANLERQAKGLRVLSPAEYLSAEAGYRQVLQSFGLPAGFYDSPEDFSKFIGADVSVQEVNDRAKVAQEAFLGSDPLLRQQWRDMYGLSDGAGIAALLDEDKAMPIVNRMATAAKGGASAVRNGLNADTGRLEQYADQGYTADQLASGFSQIGATRQAETSMANRFGTQFSQADAEASRIQGLASAQRKQAQLYGSEQALFDGRASADKTSLNRRTSGSY